MPNSAVIIANGKDFNLREKQNRTSTHSNVLSYKHFCDEHKEIILSPLHI